MGADLRVEGDGGGLQPQSRKNAAFKGVARVADAVEGIVEQEQDWRRALRAFGQKRRARKVRDDDPRGFAGPGVGQGVAAVDRLDGGAANRRSLAQDIESPRRKDAGRPENNRVPRASRHRRPSEPYCAKPCPAERFEATAARRVASASTSAAEARARRGR